MVQESEPIYFLKDALSVVNGAVILSAFLQNLKSLITKESVFSAGLVLRFVRRRPALSFRNGLLQIGIGVLLAVSARKPASSEQEF